MGGEIVGAQARLRFDLCGSPVRLLGPFQIAARLGALPQHGVERLATLGRQPGRAVEEPVERLGASRRIGQRRISARQRLCRGADRRGRR